MKRRWTTGEVVLLLEAVARNREPGRKLGAISALVRSGLLQRSERAAHHKAMRIGAFSTRAVRLAVRELRCRGLTHPRIARALGISALASMAAVARDRSGAGERPPR